MKTRMKVWWCLIALLLITACGEKTDYRNAIPSDAGIVMGFHLDAIAQKGELNRLIDKAEIDTFLRTDLEASSYEYIMRIVENPTQTGLDFSATSYIFYVPDSEAGFLFKVNDVEKVEQLFRQLSGDGEGLPLTEEEDVRYLALGSNAMVAFNESTLLFLYMMNDYASLTNRVMTLLMQDETESFWTDKALRNLFEATKGDVVSVINYDAMIPVQYKSILPSSPSEGVSWSDLNILYAISFENGKMVVEGNWYSANETALAWMEDCIKITKPLTARLLPKNDPMLWIGAGINGDKMYEWLQNSPQYSMLFEQVDINWETLFSAMEGDMVISLSDMDWQAGQTNIALQLQVALKKEKEEEFMYTLLSIVPVVKAEGNDYTASWMENEIRFGVDENHCFYAILNEPENAVLTTTPREWIKEVEGSLCYYHIDLHRIVKLLSPFMMSSQHVQVLELFDCINLKMVPDEPMVAEITMKNLNENFLKQLVDFAMWNR